MSRPKRKVDHVKHALQTEDSGLSGFADLFLVPEPSPEIRLEEVDSSCRFLGKELQAPLLINAMTGGHRDVKEINAGLGEAASVTGIAVAVGSQRAALEDPGVKDTFAVVRERNPEGIVLANLNAGCSYEDALKAVEMLRADGIQLYLNVAQELSMAEGDVDFRGVGENISRLVEKLPVPVIIKEVGFGISRETVQSLAAAGVRWIDVGGRGGTSFAAIEGLRRGREQGPFTEWGIPTAAALLEALSTGTEAGIIASGGVRSSLDVAKSLVAGAFLTGMAKPFLKVLRNGSVKGLVQYITELKSGLRSTMMALGAKNTGQMRDKQMVITGLTAQWLERRGINLDEYARR